MEQFGAGIATLATAVISGIEVVHTKDLDDQTPLIVSLIGGFAALLAFGIGLKMRLGKGTAVLFGLYMAAFSLYRVIEDAKTSGVSASFGLKDGGGATSRLNRMVGFMLGLSIIGLVVVGSMGRGGPVRYNQAPARASANSQFGAIPAPPPSPSPPPPPPPPPSPSPPPPDA